MSDFALNRTDQLLTPRVVRIPKRKPVTKVKAKATRPPRRPRKTVTAPYQPAERGMDLYIRSTSLWPRSYR